MQTQCQLEHSEVTLTLPPALAPGGQGDIPIVCGKSLAGIMGIMLSSKEHSDLA